MISIFVDNLADALQSDPLREKVLLAPSRRVGRQWIDRAAARCGGVANVRIADPRRLLLDLAEPDLLANGLRPAAFAEKAALLGRELAALSGGDGYFTRLPASLNLVESILRSIEELENTGIADARALDRRVTPPEKARELAALLRGFQTARRRQGLAGPAETHTAAVRAVSKPGFAPPLLLIPVSLTENFTVLEARFLDAWPSEAKRYLNDAGGDSGAEREFFVATGIADEAREVLRRIMALAVPLDRVEVICLDAESYVPALCQAGFELFDVKAEELPMTFSGGLPGCFSRTGRLLAGWLEWLELGFPAEGLARLLEAELLGDGWRSRHSGTTAAELAARLRCLPIVGWPDYRRCLGADPDRRTATAEKWLARRLPSLAPTPGADGQPSEAAAAVLTAALAVVRFPGPARGKLDAYVREGLEREIAGWLPHCGWPGFDAVAWLTTMVERLRVMGLGAMPGRLHVTDVSGGGHGGREYTFVLGLDDSRFPGSVRQDPVLLDRERAGLSARLALSGRQRRRREEEMAQLLARLSGKVFLSYARRGTQADREQFPSLLYTHLLSEQHAAPEHVGLAPPAPEKSLNRRDVWLRTLLDKPARSLDAAALEPWHPHLAAAAQAEQARAGSAFTAYDGLVPEAGHDFFLECQAVSPTDLEKLATCPQEFFFRRILGVKPPERYEPAPGRWLEARERGNLLHDLFQQYLQEMAATGDTAGDAGLLAALLEKAVAGQAAANPPRDRLAFHREVGELREACDIFLKTETVRRRAGDPLYMEVILGGAEAAATPWDRETPVTVRFGDHAAIALRGRVDRIDRLHGGGLRIYDYKTGKSDRFDADDPFHKGRHLQHFLYARMLEQTLAEKGLPEPVRGFAYFFPMPADEGKTILYSRADLEQTGTDIMNILIRLLARGCFTFTTDARDAGLSDYLPIYGDAKLLAKSAWRKATADPLLTDWLVLRGAAREGD